jgi:hypothetical protein
MKKTIFNSYMMVAAGAILFLACTGTTFGQTDCGTSCEITGLPVLYLPSGQSANTLAVGYGALTSNTTGIDNTATGASALQANTTGPHNTADGEVALVFNTTGGDNTAVGTGSLFFNTTGSANSALGYAACQGVTTANNVICIGQNVAGANTSNSTYVAGIYGRPTTGKGNPLVCVDKTGKLGTTHCAAKGHPSMQQETINQQEQQIQLLQKRNEEFQQRLSRLESLIAKK